MDTRDRPSPHPHEHRPYYDGMVQRMLLALIAHLTQGDTPPLTVRRLDAWLSARADAPLLATLRDAPTTDGLTRAEMATFEGYAETTHALVAMLRAAPHDPWWRARIAAAAPAAGLRLAPSWLTPLERRPALVLMRGGRDSGRRPVADRGSANAVRADGGAGAAAPDWRDTPAG